MKDQRMDAAKDAVEQMANSVGPVPPPRGLRAGRRPGRGGAAVLALLLAAVALAAWWMRGAAPAPGPDPAPVAVSEEAGVVVEHLRINGRSVQAKVERLPEAGAVMVTMVKDASAPSTPEPEGEDS